VEDCLFSGLASMPLVETRHSSTLPLVTLQTHLSGLSLSLALRIWTRVFAKSEMYVFCACSPKLGD
jgi:hypothetical protein